MLSIRTTVQEASRKPLNYSGGPLGEKLKLPQTIDCCLIQNLSWLYVPSDAVVVPACILHLNLKMHFHSEEVALK